jgi:N-acetylmuramoyl-L-alanine amidase
VALAAVVAAFAVSVLSGSLTSEGSRGPGAAGSPARGLSAAASAQGPPSPSPSPSASPTRRPVPRPPIVWKPIPFGPARRAETAAYARRHYGLNTWRLEGPHVIVEHYTVTTTWQSAWNTFASNAPDVEFHELPGVCAHFIVGQGGAIYQLVRLDTICRHTVGLDAAAIGIENVGTSDAQILHDPAQLRASIRLTLWLMDRFHIRLRNVIGHNESLTSPYHRELVAAWRCQTHADWTHADMQVYRRDVAALAKRYGVPLGPPARPVHPDC